MTRSNGLLSGFWGIPCTSARYLGLGSGNIRSAHGNGMLRVEIRRIRQADIPNVLDLLAQQDMDADVVLPEAEARDVLDRIVQRPDCHMHVAEADGEIVGMFMLVIIQHLSHRGARSGIIEDVVVRTDRQGEGIGREMMAFAADLAKAAGCYKLMLSSGTGRASAHAFYEALGYERHGYSYLLRMEAHQGSKTAVRGK